MKIDHIELGKYPVLLAPMEDVTDLGFRLMCKEFGADLVYTEFVSSDALIRQVNKSMQKLTISDEERPVAIQIYGRDVDSMTEAAKIFFIQITQFYTANLSHLDFYGPIIRMSFCTKGQIRRSYAPIYISYNDDTRPEA